MSDGSGDVDSVPRIDGPSESALAQPLSSFPIVRLVCRFRCWILLIPRERRRSSVGLAALAKMPEAQMHMRLPQSPREYARALPPMRAQTTPSQNALDETARAPKAII